VSFLIDDDMRMLRDSARRLFEGLDSIRALRRRRDAGDIPGLARGAWTEMTELGLPGVLVPEAFGGSGLGLRASIQIAEMMGKSLETGPFVASAVMGVTAILGGSNEDLKARLLPEIAAGETVIAIAAEETARHRPDSVATTATRKEGGILLAGTKCTVIGGAAADFFIVTARIQSEIGLFLVDAHAPGLAVTSGLSVDGQPWTKLILDGVAVSDADRIDGPDLVSAILERTLDAGRLHLAAEMLGCAQEAFDRALDYLKTRVQFGRKIGEFQALQHRAAILLGELEIARSVVMKAAALWDAHEPEARTFVSLAKARVGQIACHVTTEAVQFHGGIGVTDEFDIGLFLKRARAAADQLGDSAFHTERYAQLQGL
jgi:acyl-CoA dehydrogenase